jgi:hypothetical protein
MRVPGFFSPLSTTMPDGVDRMLNLYREETGDKERPYRFVRRPGLITRVEGLHGIVRGGIELDGMLYVVAGKRLYRIDAAWDAQELGELDHDTRPVMMICNGTQALGLQHQYARLRAGHGYRPAG